ncbi:MAG: hypothetical protein HY664_05430 [Chloroflexi bacterium]|nr:hypothetical protein [Chloroflexota bacterium]
MTENANLFKGATRTSVKVFLLEEELQKALELIKENHWDEEEGHAIIFVNGLYHLRGERSLQALTCNDNASASEIERLSGELIAFQSKYAVMKFRAFSLDEAKQTLEFNVTGLKKQKDLSNYRIRKFREDEELLQAELRRLRQENEELRQRLALDDTQAEPILPKPNFVRRALGRLKR